MDPNQPKQHSHQGIQQQDQKQLAKGQLLPDKIIEMMRKTKKTDPLFKPLKKLKNALESIGYDRISMNAEKNVILFHFGLGNELDLQFINKTNPNNCMITNPIIPGRSYCYLNFASVFDSQKYLCSFHNILDGVPIGYLEIGLQKLKRVMICMYSRVDKEESRDGGVGVGDTLRKYEGTIPGIYLFEQFVSREEEIKLMEGIDEKQWEKLNNRRVQHYGFEFKYGKNGIDKDEQYNSPMPQFIQPVLEKLKNIKLGCPLSKTGSVQKNQISQKQENSPKIPINLDQMTINDYFPGDGIPAHFDTHSPFEQCFVALSLLSGIVMQWRKYDGQQVSLYLPARSLVVFSGEGRYAWTHGISCRKVDRVDGELVHRSRRISLTLRKIKYDECRCKYNFYCDSQGYDQNTMKKQNPLLIKYMYESRYKKMLEKQSLFGIYKKYVLDAYNGFGFDFHNRVIQGVQRFIRMGLEQQRQKGQKRFLNILDVGCGNGEYKSLLQSLVGPNESPYFSYTGIEICQKMKEFEDKIHMDGMNLLFRDGTFDMVLCVAVVHHLSSKEDRLKILKELVRVVGDGIIIISVFGYENKREIYDSQDILLEYCLPKAKIRDQGSQGKGFEGKKIEEGEDENRQGFDGKVEKQRTRQRGQVFQRYYHLFEQKQLRQLIEEAGIVVIGEQKDKQNIVIMGKRLLK